jgi:hypothetical protein
VHLCSAGNDEKYQQHHNRITRQESLHAYTHNTTQLVWQGFARQDAAGLFTAVRSVT